MDSVKPETNMSAEVDFRLRAYRRKFLATRVSARPIREDLESQVREHGPDATVTIDLNGIEAMTISFADELIGRFYNSLAAGHIPAEVVQIVGVNEETRETIHLCLERLDLIAVIIDDGRPILLGRSDPLEETFEKALALGEFSANDLAHALSITAQNANNRLKRLVGAAAIRRRRVSLANRGGKEFTYTAVGARR
ncbi:MAG TPA: hypothetical protein DGT23_29735 [Micromonosporaceae bacterium]|nr:hypothetical protein [Micromonosporaceae bacterium]